jgi:hypothetical protein
MWTCPRCGHRFRWRDQSHSCTSVAVADHLNGKPPAVAELYGGLERTVLALGPDVQVEAVKTRIAFVARMRFAVATVQRRGLRCHVILHRALEHPRVVSAEAVGPTAVVNVFRLDRPEDLDDDVRSWLAEAYELGSDNSPT